MIDNDNFRAMLVHLGFNQDNQSVASVMRRSYGANHFELSVDFSSQKIIYPTGHGFKIHQAQTCNFASAENAVVLECVHRLFEKGYKPEHIELEPQWKLGHGGKSGRADILVRDQQGIALLLIECKTAGREFDKAWKDTLADGAQLFSYVEQEKATQFVCLYASEFDTKKQSISLSQKIISVKDNTKILDDNPKALAFNAATNAKERFMVCGQQLPRTSWSAMGQIMVPMFSVAAQNQMIPAIDDLEQSIATAQSTIAAAPAQKQAILQKYL